MLIDTVLFAVGLALLYYGAELLVRGSTNIAIILGVRPIVVGLTVVAFGTSMPELVASLIAVFRGSPDIALGNVIGSNIANIGLVMACGAIFFPLAILKSVRNREMPFLAIFTAALAYFCLDGSISKVDGAILFIGVILFTTYYTVIVLKKRNGEADVVEEEVSDLTANKHNLTFELAITAIGTGGVILGAYLMVESAATIARALGVSELVIGITIVAVGTSLPELATTVVAALRKHSDIAVGNIIGSNIYNIGLVLGTVAMVEPIAVPWKILTGEISVMALFTVALILLSLRLKVDRASGTALLIGYICFIAWVAELV